MSSDKKYFYKILDSPPPEPLPEKLPETELDIKDNFIHLSVRPFFSTNTPSKTTPPPLYSPTNPTHPNPTKKTIQKILTYEQNKTLQTAVQVPLTADIFFATHHKLWLLKIRVADLDGDIQFRPELPECPHLHHSVRGLGKSNVEEVIVVEKPESLGEGSIWAKVPEMEALED